MFGYGRVFTRALGTRLWDDQGREYVDLLAGFGSHNLGHRHPRLTALLADELASQGPDLMHVGPSLAMGALAEELCARSGLERALFATSGAEAVDAALKLARAATGRSGVVHCQDGFHGTSLGTLSVMGSARLRAPFEPLLAGTSMVAFGDRAALQRALTPSVGAFVVESVLGEGGVIPAPAGYLEEAAELCARNGTLLVLDEVQTGLGRTGTMFSFRPDVLVLGKALGGGMLPVSCALTTAALHTKAYGTMDRFDLHGSTFAGYALGCCAGRATLSILDEEGLVARAGELGARLLAALRARLEGHPLVRDVRGSGLLIGLELGPPADNGVVPRFQKSVARNVFGQWLALRMLEQGYVCQPSALRWDVLRLEPPLTIAWEDLQRAVEAIGAILDGYRDLTPLLRDVGARLGQQFLKGWKF